MFHGAIDAGSITHAWMGDSQPDAKTMALFIEKIYNNSQNDQVVFSPTFTRCNNCGAVQKGEHNKCAKCQGEEVTYVTRVTGYFGEVDKWNKGKQQERADRKQHTERALSTSPAQVPIGKDIVLYGKVGCSVCETVHQQLEDLRTIMHFEYKYELIDSDKPDQSSIQLASLLARNVRDIPTLIIGSRSWSVKMPTIATIESAIKNEIMANG
jgi:hypothetical protein